MQSVRFRQDERTTRLRDLGPPEQGFQNTRSFEARLAKAISKVKGLPASVNWRLVGAVSSVQSQVMICFRKCYLFL